MVHESPKVGTNLRDHLQIKMCYQDLQKTSNLDYTWKMLPWYLEWRKDPIKSARLGRIGSNMLPVGGFRKLNDQSEHPDVQHHILIVEVNDHARKVSTFVYGTYNSITYVATNEMGFRRSSMYVAT